MQYDTLTQAAATFVCHSNLDLHIACDHLRGHYHLPVFHFDAHSNWAYARAVGQHIGFNVTKTNQLDTIAQWMQGVPENVNYQIILYLDQTASTAPDAMQGARVRVEDAYTFLQSVFATNILLIGQRA